MHVCVDGAFATRAANEEREPCQHLTAGLPCATWIMSSDNESCVKSQRDLWDPLCPPFPEVRGARRGAGLPCVSPATPFPFWGRGELLGLLISSLELHQLLEQLRGPASGWPCPAALPRMPQPGAVAGRDI